MLTAEGTAAAFTTDSLLASVLALAGIEVPPARTAPAAAVPLPRDPFRSESWATPALTQQQSAV